MIVYDRSRVVADLKCPRYRYWAYEHDGKGLTSEGTHLELFLGTAIHDGLAGIARGLDIDDLAEVAVQQVRQGIMANAVGEPGAEDFSYEQAALVEGLLRGFHRSVWPRLREEYPTIVAIEQEYTYEHDGQTFMARPDLLVANSDGIHYLEYKSTNSIKAQ